MILTSVFIHTSAASPRRPPSSQYFKYLMCVCPNMCQGKEGGERIEEMGEGRERNESKREREGGERVGNERGKERKGGKREER